MTTLQPTSAKLPCFTLANSGRNDMNVALAIIDLIISEFGVSKFELTSRRRPERIAWPRQIAMTLIREHTNFSLQDIGDLFGGKDHGTVLHAIEVVKGFAEVDQKFAAQFKLLSMSL